MNFKAIEVSEKVKKCTINICNIKQMFMLKMSLYINYKPYAKNTFILFSCFKSYLVNHLKIFDSYALALNKRPKPKFEIF